jgi:hypothetical protein
MKPINITLAAIALALSVSACGQHFDVARPDDFLELAPEDSRRYGYEMRATTADGVVVGVREIDNPRHGSRDFWVDAIRNRLRRDAGYALTSESDVTGAAGASGHQLRFGHDESSRPYVYWITVFVTHDRVFVVEAGGRREPFEAAQARVEQAIASFRVL